MNITRALTTLAAILVAFVAPRVTAADIPAGPNAPTRATFDRARTAFDVKRMLDQYRASNRRNPAHDAAAEAFLAGCAKRFNAQPDAPPAADLERQGRLLYVDGCADPLVALCYARLAIRPVPWGASRTWSVMPIQPPNETAVIRPLLTEAASELGPRGYGAAFLAEARHAMAVIRRANARPEDVKKADAALVDAIARAAADPAYAANRAYLADDVYRWTERFSSDQFRALADAADKLPAADEWLKRYARGTYHAGAAREGRAGAPAHAASATEHLTAAWELDRTLPEAAIRMVALGVAPGDDAGARLWFDRAVAARLDEPDAYAARFRWLSWASAAPGPRADAVYAAGLEAARTARFDTEAPRRLLTALDIVRRRPDGGGYAAWNDLGAWPHLKTVLEGYVASPAHKADANRNRTALAAFAARLGKYDEAAAHLAKLPNNAPDPAGAADANYRPLELQGDVEAHTGPAAEHTLRAERFAAAKDFEQAADAFDRALAAAPTPAAKRFLRDRLRAATWQRQYDAGDWVDLAADPDLSGFAPGGGDWSAAPDGSVIARVTGSLTRLTAMLDVGDDWELNCDVVFLNADDEWSNAGIELVDAHGAQHAAVALCYNVRRVYAGDWTFDERSTDEIRFRTFNALHVRHQGGKLTVTLDRRPIPFERPATSTPRTANAPRHLAFGGHVWNTGDTMRFERIRVRKINN